MKNSQAVGKFIIVKDLNFSDFMKDENGKIKTYKSHEEASEVCGMYEFEDVLILEVKTNYKE